MNQTQKRLQIINIAISITDIDTIQLQMLKLNQIKTDEKLQNILSTLDSRNYAKAQTLISTYLEQPISDDIIQRVDESIISDEDIEKFELYNEELEEDNKTIEIDLDDMLKIQQNNYKPENNQQTNNCIDVDFDSLLNITEKDIKPSEIDLSSKLDNQNDIEPITTNQTTKYQQDNKYEAIPYIKKKFQDMLVKYPIKNPKFDSFVSVDRWLEQIENDGYSEENIEEMIDYILKISHKNPAEAAQLLLITASTQSIYAKFMLARELYKGNILEQNKDEAFQMIYDLAINEEYPEAICDLAQFYEYGIGVKKDIKKALKLYDEAMQLGITRAMRNYDRLSKQKKSLFGLF